MKGEVEPNSPFLGLREGQLPPFWAMTIRAGLDRLRTATPAPFGLGRGSRATLDIPLFSETLLLGLIQGLEQGAGWFELPQALRFTPQRIQKR